MCYSLSNNLKIRIAAMGLFFEHIVQHMHAVTNYGGLSSRGTRESSIKRRRKWKSCCSYIALYSVKPKFPQNSFKWHDSTATSAARFIFNAVARFVCLNSNGGWSLWGSSLLRIS